MRRLDGITSAVDVNWGKPGRWRGTERPGVAESRTAPGDWTAAVTFR